MRTTLPCLLLLSATAFAQSVVVPNANANVAGSTGLNTIIRNAGAPRTYQYGASAAELTNVPIGSVITGVSVRLYTGGVLLPAWPATDVTWSTYDIWAGPAAPLAGWGVDPAANFSSPPQQVRTGPLTLDAGDFSNLGLAGTPNPWAEFYFDFQQPYLYLGGDLALLFSHPGSNSAAAAEFPDVVVPDAATHGVSRSQSVQNGNNTVVANFYVMRIHYGYGAGCAASSGNVPVLVQNADLTGGTGGDLLFTTVNAAPGSLALLAGGFSQLGAPIGGGCTLLVSPDVVLFAGITDAKGRVTLSLSVPAAAAGSFFAQGAVLDSALPLGFCVTNAVSPSAN